MKRELQIDILKELISQLDEKRNVDAGVMYRNPTSAYTCPETARREWDTFFRGHPQLIALSGSLPKPGTVMTVDDFGVPVLATRDGFGRFRAFLNACRHRGARVAEEARGEAKSFVCPNRATPCVLRHWDRRASRAAATTRQTGRFWRLLCGTYPSPTGFTESWPVRCTGAPPGGGISPFRVYSGCVPFV
jgi:hypothetical protein